MLVGALVRAGDQARFTEMLGSACDFLYKGCRLVRVQINVRHDSSQRYFWMTSQFPLIYELLPSHLMWYPLISVSECHSETLIANYEPRQ